MKNKDSFFAEGRNCWKTAPTRRAAFLIDAQSYFDAFYKTIEHAQHSIYLACWDIDSRTVLRPGEPEEENSRLGATLNRLASGRSGLHVHILAWDYAMIFALGREPLPVFNLGWRSHRRVHFHMDDRHPLGACHHRKMVVVDDSVAFVGGIDLTKRRWDTSEHLPDDPRRKDPLGLSYEPVHDVQMMVDGPVAQAAGRLFRKYWLRATGRKIKRKADSDFDPWPREITPDITDAAAALSRTEPAHKGQREVREVEHLYRDSISQARRSIYIENQYLTSPCIADTLAERLKEPDGPEIVIIQPYRCSGWLEEGTMGAIRAKVVQKLYAADTSHRLRVYYPVTGGSSERDIHVHTKLCIIDNRMVRIGSSNLSNRSMGFDTECDLSCDSGGKADIEQSITLLRNRLLGEHLGVSADTVARYVSREGSLIKAVESLAGNENRTLKALHAEVPEWLAAIAPDPSLVDPETPIESEAFIRELAPAEQRAGGTIDKLSIIIDGVVKSPIQ